MPHANRCALSFVVLGSLLLTACSKPETAPDPIRAVRTMTIAPQSTAGTYEYAAEVKPRIESRLSFRVGGKMVKRLVNVGDTVKAGQVLAQLDPQDLRLGQDAAVAAVASAQANLDQTAADFKRYKELNGQGFIGKAELDKRESAVKTARATLTQAQAQSNVQGNQATYAALVADVSGVVTAVDLEPGMVAAAGTPVVRVAQDGHRDVVFAVPEDRVNLVKALAGQPGRFKVKLWDANSAPLNATIREIAAAADPVTRTFLVKADVGQITQTGVRLGQTATVVMELPPTSGITKLPLSALREEQGRSTVWLLDKPSMTVKVQPVTLAGADGNQAVITAGLAPGQVVVTAGVHVLNPGQKVKLYVDPAAPAASSNATPVSVK
jgi:membrane fusion protein, multidrug efflux system